MSISISSNTPVQAPQKTSAVEATDSTRAGKDLRNDGDADESAKAKSASAAQPVTNTLGQLIGTNLNVKA